MKILPFLLNLMSFFIFPSLQEHVNSVSSGPCQDINHHCHIDKFSLINFMLQYSDPSTPAPSGFSVIYTLAASLDMLLRCCVLNVHVPLKFIDILL